MPSSLALALAWLLGAAGGAPAEAPAGFEAPAAPATVTFEQALALALERSPRLEVARAAVERAEAVARQTRAAWLPNLRAQASYTLLDAPRTLGDRVLVAQETLGAQLILSAPLVDVRQWRQSARAGQAVEAARAQASDTRRELAELVGRSYLGVLLERQALEVAERAVATSKAQLEIARTRRKEGVGTRLEEVRAERELRDNQGRAALGRALLASAQEALGVAAGHGAPLDAAAPVALPSLPTRVEALAAARERADVRALRQELEVARQAVADGWLDYLPTLGLLFQPFAQEPPTPTVPRLGWQAQLGLAVPLYDGGARYAQQSERVAQVRRARAALEEALLRAEAEVRAAASELQHREEALVQAQASAELAEEALALARAAFHEGAATQVDLIEAERSARDAAASVAVAQSARDRARLLLLAAAGQWPEPAGPTVTGRR